jgi:hypothetical protein
MEGEGCVAWVTFWVKVRGWEIGWMIPMSLGRFDYCSLCIDVTAATSSKTSFQVEYKHKCRQ